MTKPLEPFVVRHYTGDELPCIKGNGFDGLQIGESREAAEALVSWLNGVIADARRYRALRELEWFEDDLAVVRHPKQAVKLGHDCPSRERLDAFVDEIVARRADS